MKIDELLKEIESALPVVVWVPDLHEVGKAAPAINFRAHVGTAKGWRFLVAGFDRYVPDYDGRHYDGTATKGGIIMHLTPELAKKAGELAERP